MTQELLQKLYDYHPDGYFNHRISRPGCTKGSRALGKKSKNEITLGCAGKLHRYHRLIFLYHHGFLPVCIDHINGDPHDNRIENLRAATHAENRRNNKLYKNNTLGFKGLARAYGGKFVAYLKVNGRVYNSSVSDTVEEAAKKYDKLALKHHGDFACLNYPS